MNKYSERVVHVWLFACTSAASLKIKTHSSQDARVRKARVLLLRLVTLQSVKTTAENALNAIINGSAHHARCKINYQISIAIFKYCNLSTEIRFFSSNMNTSVGDDNVGNKDRHFNPNYFFSDKGNKSKNIFKTSCVRATVSCLAQCAPPASIADQFFTHNKKH